MPDIDVFRAALAVEDEEAILDRFLFVEESEHVSIAQKDAIRAALGAAYGVDISAISIRATGSAHLGFSLMPKRDGNTFLPPYRSFSAASDLDIAVISHPIWELISKEISDFSHRSRPFPWRAYKFGDYLVCGLMRPDHFPKARLVQCDLWWKVFNSLSRDATYGRRKVRGGLYYSEQYFRDYSRRAIQAAKQRELLNENRIDQ